MPPANIPLGFQRKAQVPANSLESQGPNDAPVKAQTATTQKPRNTKDSSDNTTKVPCNAASGGRGKCDGHFVRAVIERIGNFRTFGLPYCNKCGRVHRTLNAPNMPLDEESNKKYSIYEPLASRKYFLGRGGAPFPVPGSRRR